ncbi:hypothetical protein AALO_G00009840 [Alosa alosa]|uniref:Uncharacterized protein n=1 Tax=Alosa alosa TaxID=278164 RepID=A0AAV6HF68_9TELE|nr:hypothetical protein AALO_G00009840 [Alosa alosa]
MQEEKLKIPDVSSDSPQVHSALSLNLPLATSGLGPQAVPTKVTADLLKARCFLYFTRPVFYSGNLAFVAYI